jgi:hypothetical protein
MSLPFSLAEAFFTGGLPDYLTLELTTRNVEALELVCLFIYLINYINNQLGG